MLQDLDYGRLDNQYHKETPNDNDIVVLGAEALKDDKHIDLKELVLRKNHPWNGKKLKEIKISNKALILMVKRNGEKFVHREQFIYHKMWLSKGFVFWKCKVNSSCQSLRKTGTL